MFGGEGGKGVPDLQDNSAQCFFRIRMLRRDPVEVIQKNFV